MFIQYFKGEPGTHVIRYRNGRLIEHGDGTSFWYLPLNTSVAAVPVVNQEAQFVFSETTQNYQEITIQGAVTYRITDPVHLASRLSFAVDPKTHRFRSEDPDKLLQWVVNAVQRHTRSKVTALPLETALTKVMELSGQVLGAVQAEEVFIRPWCGRREPSLFSGKDHARDAKSPGGGLPRDIAEASRSGDL